MMDFVKESLGQLDILVSNAATGGFRPLLSANARHFHNAMNTNALALVLLVQRAMPLLEQGSGRGKVIAISSHGAEMALPWYGLIGGSKAALESLVRHMTLEVGDRGVNVNVVKAGLVETDSTRVIPNAEAMFQRRPQAASLLEGRSTRVAVIRDIELLEPMRFYTDRVCKAWVNGIAGLDGIECVLTSDFHSRAGKLVQADRPYMRARVDLSDITSLGDVQPPLTPLDPYTAFNYPDNVVLYHGEVFRALKEVKVEGKHAWGRLISLDISEFGGQRTGDDWIIPSSAIDAAFYTCGIHVRDSIPGVAKIPKSIRSLRVGRFPRRGEQLLVFATCRELGSEYGIYDFTIYGADGSVVAIVDGYHGVFVPRGGN